LAGAWRERDHGNPVLSLALHSSLLAIVATLDWRIMCGALFLAALTLRLMLARTLSPAALRETAWWSRRLFLGDLLIAGGTLFFFLLASNHLELRGQEEWSLIVQLRDFFARIELLDDARPERAAQFAGLARPAVGLMLAGVLLRLPLVNDPLVRSDGERPSLRIVSIWIWLYAVVIGVSFALRVIQMVPEAAYAILIPLRGLLILAIVLLGVAASVTLAPRAAARRMLPPLGMLLAAGVCTPNPTALGGVYLLLGFLPLISRPGQDSGRDTAANGEREPLPLSVVPVVAGCLLILLGLFQGSGSGDRGLVEPLAAGAGLTLLVLSLLREEAVPAEWVSRGPVARAANGEFPVWKPNPPDSLPPGSSTAARNSINLARVALILGLLLLPQEGWQRIRGDLRKVAFPRAAAEPHLSRENAVPGDRRPARPPDPGEPPR
jgi:hypothetical protein